MAVICKKDPSVRDIELLYETVRVAHQAKEKGNHPFGCLLADAEGNILLEGENTVVTEHNDCGHSETNLMIAASKTYSRDFLATCSIYITAEPCVMCTGAILSLIHISEPTRLGMISYAVFCLKKKKKKKKKTYKT